MALPTTYTQEYKRFKDFFGKIRDAQAPPKFTYQLLIDWGTNQLIIVLLFHYLNL